MKIKSLNILLAIALFGFGILTTTIGVNAQTLTEGSLIKTTDRPEVYIINDKSHGSYLGWKRHIFNPEVFNMYGHLNWNAINVVSQTTLNAYETSDLYKADVDPRVYSLEEYNSTAIKHHIANVEAFNSRGYSWNQIFIVNEKEVNYYATGASLGVISQSIKNVASLTANNTATIHVTKNASNFKMLEVKFDGNETVNSLTVKKLGFSSISDFGDGVYLFKDGIRFTEKKTFSNNDSTATFTNLNLQAPFVLGVMVDFDGTSGNVVKIELNGNYIGLPLTSNNFTFVNVDSGTIVVSNTGSIENPVVGQINAQVSEFKITNTDDEPVSVKHIELYNSGHNILSNVKLSDGTNTWSGTVSNNRLIFDLNSSIKENKSKTFKVYANVGGNDGDSISLFIRDAYDVRAIGEQYGFGVTVNISSFNQPSESHELTLAVSGNLSVVAKSTNDVMGYWGQTVNDVAKFRFKADDSEGFFIDELQFASSTQLTNGAEKMTITYKTKSGNIISKTETIDDDPVLFDSFVLNDRPYVAKDSTMDLTVGLILRNDEDSIRLDDFEVILENFVATGENSNEELESTVNLSAINGVSSNASTISLSKSGSTILTPSDDVVFSVKFNSDDKTSAFATSTGGILLNFNYANNSTSFDDVLVKVFVNGSEVDQTDFATSTEGNVINSSGSHTIRLTDDDSIELTDGEDVDIRIEFDLTDFSYDDGDRFVIEIKDDNNQITWIDDFDGDNEVMRGNMADLNIELPLKFIYKD